MPQFRSGSRVRLTPTRSAARCDARSGLGPDGVEPASGTLIVVNRRQVRDADFVRLLTSVPTAGGPVWLIARHRPPWWASLYPDYVDFCSGYDTHLAEARSALRDADADNLARIGFECGLDLRIALSPALPPDLSTVCSSRKPAMIIISAVCLRRRHARRWVATQRRSGVPVTVLPDDDD